MLLLWRCGATFLAVASLARQWNFLGVGDCFRVDAGSLAEFPGSERLFRDMWATSRPALQALLCTPIVSVKFQRQPFPPATCAQIEDDTIPSILG